MRRGELFSGPAPELHVCWDVLFRYPESGWRGFVWRLALRFRLMPILVAWLEPQQYLNNRLRKDAQEYNHMAVYIGPKWFVHVLSQALAQNRMWVLGIHQAENWHLYAMTARTNAQLLRVVVRPEQSLPVMQGLEVERYQMAEV